jgi:membrane associated rhomboid family serine protease
MDAALAKEFLSSHGIQASVRGDDLWMASGELPMTSETSPSVWVHAEDFERSAQLLADWGTPTSATRSLWFCSRCHETNEEQFTNCWKCGADGSLSPQINLSKASSETLNVQGNHALQKSSPRYIYDRALLTELLVIICFIVFAHAQSYDGQKPFEQSERLGYLSAQQVWSGNLLGLLTTNFIHPGRALFAFCIIWFWVIGRQIELRKGRLNLVIVVLVSALSMQTASLIVHGRTQPGLLGVIFAAFVFSWLTKCFAIKGNENQAAIVLVGFFMSCLSLFLSREMMGSTFNAGFLAAILAVAVVSKSLRN